jgi:hypothetical protein
VDRVDGVLVGFCMKDGGCPDFREGLCRSFCSRFQCLYRSVAYTRWNWYVTGGS